MKKAKRKNLITRAILTLFVVALMLGGAIWHISAYDISANASESELSDVRGDFFLGIAEGIKDPEKVTTSQGYYFNPSAYVYLGSVYNDSTSTYEPILFRVLDADADNTGAGGAMFLLSEQAVRLDVRFSMNGEATNDYMDWENIYNKSFFEINSNMMESYTKKELPFIRAITKTDDALSMAGAFGYNYEGMKWELDLRDGSEALVNNKKVFIPSVDEIQKYVASYSGAPGLAATHMTSGASTAWWLRTGVDDIYGNLVGAVDANGRVIQTSADGKAAVRIATNLESSEIAYSRHLGNNIYKLAMLSPLYKDSEAPFKAEVFDVNGNTVTLKYTNVYPSTYYNSGDTKNISIIIKDKDTGEVKYYGAIGEAAYEGNADTISTKEYQISFTLPDGYNDGDTVLAFWELTQFAENSISFVSEMVDIGCIHTPQSNATCKDLAVCSKCGKSYGRLDYFTHTEESLSNYKYDSASNTHVNVCLNCGDSFNEQPCSFGITCISPCVCGNVSNDPEKHRFDENGICKLDSTHYQDPVMLDKGILTDFEIYNEGQLISFALYVNSGNMTKWGYPSIVTLHSDLDFTDISGFVPIGTSENPFDALCFNGNNHVIRGVDIRSDGENIGLFGAVESVMIENLKITDCHFEGASKVGAIAGSASSADFKYILITDNVFVSADDGKEGAISAISDDSCTIYASVAYGVTNESGNNVPFTYDKNISEYNYAFCLADSEANDIGEYSLSQFESGEIGYEFSQIHTARGVYGGQDLEKDPYPTFGAKTVFKTSTCNGITVYYNNKEDTARLEAHTYSEFIEFIWDKRFFTCEARVICGACGKEVLAPADVYFDTSRVPVRGDYTASITVGGETYTSETITAIAIHIEDMIGMTYIEKDFDANAIRPEDMMDNHRLVTDPPAMQEYTVYFLDSEGNECYYAVEAGSYDLVVVGRNDYEGQTYIYEDVLIIRPITINVTPYAIEKYYDGTSKFESGFNADNDIAYYGWFTVKLSDSIKAEPGGYSLKASIEYNHDSEIYKSSVTLLLTSETVNGIILPELYQSIENKSYATEYTYGDIIPAPSADNFSAGEGASLSFEWYSVKFDYYGDPYDLVRLDGIPKNAGNYILRVKASHTDKLLSGYKDFIITVNKKQLSTELIIPSSVRTEIRNFSTWYIVPMGQEIDIKVTGLVNGDTLESAGISTSISSFCAEFQQAPGDSSKFPYHPYKNGYRVYFYVTCNEEVRNAVNYERVTSVIYVDIVPSYDPQPIEENYIHDGSAISYSVALSWNGLEALDEDHVYHYFVTVQDENGNTINEATVDYSTEAEQLTHIIALKQGGTYNFIVTARLYDTYYRNYSETVLGIENKSFTVNITNEHGEMLDNMTDIGKYSVSIGENSADIYIKRQIKMLVKECSFNLSDGTVEFDIKNIIMEAGGVFLLGHSLSDVELFLDKSRGKITVDSFKVTDANGNDVSYLYSLNTTVSAWNHSNGGSNVVHIYDSSCDQTCNVSYCEQTRAASHKGGIATCSTLAICSECSAPYGELDASRHETADTIFVPDSSDLSNHKSIYACCGEKLSSEKHTATNPATCTQRAVCDICSWVFGELDPNNHSSTERSYAKNADPSVHDVTYECCKAVKREAHFGGNAFCDALAVCDGCKSSYGALDPNNHSAPAIAVQSKDDPSKHTRSYECCEASYFEAHSGGEASCILSAQCQYCRASYGELDPSNHASTEIRYEVYSENGSMHNMYHSCCNAYINKEYHSGGEPNCISAAICQHCGEAYGVPNQSNHASSEFSYKPDPINSSLHIRSYACCGIEIDSSSHTGGSASCTQGALCELCKAPYIAGTTDHVYDNACDNVCNICNETTRALAFHVDENKDDKCDHCTIAIEKEPISGGAISAICVGSVTVAGFGGFSLFWFVFKKRSLSELLKLLIG
ncbi:MAG: hypothetical protein J6A83_07200 [Clostridia bacterium]|nr:hypothetical protein [Clostridia bacterium]